MLQSNKTERAKKSPARRIGALYFASFCMIALLSGFSQAFVLKELARQGEAMNSLGELTRWRALDHPLALSAMELLAAGSPAERAGLEDALRQAISQSQHESPFVARADSSPPAAGSKLKSARLLEEAETHRASAAYSAEQLLAVLGLRRPGCRPECGDGAAGSQDQ